MSPANLFTVTCHTKWSRSALDLEKWIQLQDSLTLILKPSETQTKTKT